MWRLWDTESEEQQLDKSASEGIPVLASNSDDSIIFVAKNPSPSLLQPPRFFEGLMQVPCLPFQVRLVTPLHPLVSTDYFFINIIIINFITWHGYELYKFIYNCLILF